MKLRARLWAINIWVTCQHVRHAKTVPDQGLHEEENSIFLWLCVVEFVSMDGFYPAKKKGMDGFLKTKQTSYIES